MERLEIGVLMSEQAATAIFTRERLDSVLSELRPKLHRYCARMTGSVIDAEDIVQEAIVKAIEAFPQAGSIANAEGWLIRIAHNTALDFLRRRARQEAIGSNEDPEMVVDPVGTVDDRLSVATSLRTFMRLPVAQRSSVILMDVLGYSLGKLATSWITAFRRLKRLCIADVCAFAKSRKSLTTVRFLSWRIPSARCLLPTWRASTHGISTRYGPCWQMRYGWTSSLSFAAAAEAKSQITLAGIPRSMIGISCRGWWSGAPA